VTFPSSQKSCAFPTSSLARKSVSAVAFPITVTPPLQPVGIKDFLALEIPARGMLLSPVLPEKSLAMLYAPRGVGKSCSVSRLAWLSRAVALS
jgi:hypothetical protein